MHSSMKRFLLRCFAAICVISLPAFAPALAQTKPAANKSQLSSAALFSLAAQQQMLAERITRSYAMLQQDVLKERAEYQLSQDVTQFEEALKQLLQAAPTAEIKENYKLLDQLWNEFQQIVKRPPSEEQVIKLTEQNEELGWISQQGAELISAYKPVPRSLEITQTAQALRLSQRLAKLYLLQTLGAKLDFVAKDMKSARTEIMDLVAKLKASKQSTPSAQRELKLVDQQWLFFANALDQSSTGREAMLAKETVAKASDNLLKALEGLTTIYITGK